CDTTGVEQMFAVLVYKVLAGGGSMTVEPAACVQAGLRSLGYSAEFVTDLMAKIKAGKDGNLPDEASVQNLIRQNIKPEHHRVFDTAVGKYSIPWPAHI